MIPKAVIFLFSAFYPASLGVIATTLVGLSILKDGDAMLSSLVFGLSFVFSVIVPPIFSRIATRLRRETITLYLYGTRSGLLIAVLVTLLLGAENNRLVLVPYICLLFILSLDQVLTSDAPVAAKDTYGTPYGSSNALGNILGRGFQSIAPLVAAAVISSETSHLLIFAIVASALLGLIYPLLSSKLERLTEPQNSPSTGNDFAIKQDGAHNKWAYWYIGFNVLVNLSQGAIGFVLLSLDPNSGGPLYASTLSFAFLLVQIFVVLGWLKFDKLGHHPGSVTYLLLINGILFGVISTLHGMIAILVTVFIIGLAYGVSIPFLSETLLDRLRGPKLREHLANGRSAGRIASIISLSLAGTALSTGISQSLIFIICGILLAASACTLLFLANRLDAAVAVHT
ncbi:hypothetical protein LJR235_004078 [Pararhizobium sp. LjRoot235]|uniref:hypothetical protein n=1 Tax=Pararhizobium sp. LjRoot235 TaxID=3342291 RepID=UPI003ECE7FEF